MATSGVALADIELRYPAVYDDWTLPQVILDVAAQILESEEDADGGQFGGDLSSMRKRAVIALTAHRLLQRNLQAGGDLSGNFVLSRSQAGGVAVEYLMPLPENLAPEFSHYYTTQPGIDYMELVRRNVGLGIRLVG